MSDVEPIPADRPGVIPYLAVDGADDAIAFYEQVFGATEMNRMPGPGGRVMHAELDIGGRVLMIADDFPDMTPDGKRTDPKSLGGTAVTLHQYVVDCDATVAAAQAAGAEVLWGPDDMFWGDRFAKIRDPFGHEWSIATHVHDVTPDEMAVGAAEAFTPPE